MARALKPKTSGYRSNASPEIIRLVIMIYGKFPLSLRNVEDLLYERHRHLQ
jgi:putative transposase